MLSTCLVHLPRHIGSVFQARRTNSRSQRKVGEARVHAVVKAGVTSHSQSAVGQGEAA